MNKLHVGVVGYCPPTRFDTGEALRLIRQSYDQVEELYPGRLISVVSGLTDVGVPSLAYQEAVRRGWRTVGVACRKAFEHPIFPVDERQIVGTEWGDESATFLNGLDLLIRIGGGPQSHEEASVVRASNKLVIEHELAKL